MKGFEQVKSKISAMPTKMKEAGNTGLREVAKQIYDTSQSQVPVDTGALRASASMSESGHAEDLTITIAYISEYALYVHEIMRNSHPKGNAKYLENPFNQYAPTLPTVVQSKIGKLT